MVETFWALDYPLFGCLGQFMTLTFWVPIEINL